MTERPGEPADGAESTPGAAGTPGGTTSGDAESTSGAAATGSGPSADPVEEERVAAMLADLGPVAMPDDVRARLDAVIGDLAAERAGSTGGTGGTGGRGAVVTPLAGRGRRGVSLAGRLLVAAGVLGVVGLGVGVVADGIVAGGGDDSAGGASSESAADTGAAPEAEAEAGGSAGSDAEGPPDAAVQSLRADRAGVLVLTGPDDLRGAVAAIAAGDGVDELARQRGDQDDSQDGGDEAADAPRDSLKTPVRDGAARRALRGAITATEAGATYRGCVVPRSGDGAVGVDAATRVLVVRYEGARALLLVDPPDAQDDRARGRVVDCDLGTLVAGATVRPDAVGGE